jgi:hypothetical protein
VSEANLFSVYFSVAVVIVAVAALRAGVVGGDVEDCVLNTLLGFCIALVWPLLAVLLPPVALGRGLKALHAQRLAGARTREEAQRRRAAQVERDYEEVTRMISDV